MKNSQILVLLATVVVAGTLGFFGGTKYQESKYQQQRGQFMMGFRNGNGNQNFYRNGGTPGPNGGMMRQGFQGMMRPVYGEIISVDDKGITVKMQDGSSKIILFGNNTTINKSDTATKTDLTTGTKVGVFGPTNADGSVTAQSIQINPNVPQNQPTPNTKQ